MAAAAMALVSCQVVEESIIEKPSGEARTIRVHATAQELANEDTKTYINAEETILWGTGEYMKLAVTPEGGTPVFANSTDASADLFDGAPTALFEFSVSPASAATYLYQGIYPASAAATTSNTNPANYKVNLPATQNATATSYDPAAYIMVAKPETFDQVESDWAVKFRRATALNKITLKNVPGGKSINKVTITASDGKYLAGGRHFNLSTGESGDIYSGGGRTETVTVKFATPAAGGANIDVWFTSWEVSLVADDVLTIVAYTTDKKSYTKTITLAGAQTISFREGYLNTLGANMSGIDPEDVTELEEGDYLVLAKNGTNYYALKAEKDPSGERLLSVDYTGSLDSYLGDADLIWSISKSGDSYIFENDGKNLGYKGTKNESYWLAADAEWTGDNYLLDVTVHEYPTYYVTLNSNASRYLSKNNPGSFFAFYGNTGQYADIVFVPASVDTRTVVTLSFDEDAVGFTTANYDSFLGQDVTASPDVAAVTGHLSWSKVDDDSVIDDFDNGVLTLTGNEGTATVTVSFTGDANYRPAQASYTITVTSAAVPQYEKVTSLSNVTAGEYIIVNAGYYLPNAAATSAGPVKSAAKVVTIVDNKVQGVTDEMTWTFSGTNDAMSIQSTADDDYYLVVSGNGNNSLRVNTTSDRTWTIADYEGTPGAFSLKDNTNNRYCATYSSGSDWRSYNSYNHANYGDGGLVYLYKLVDTREDPAMEWSAGSATATYNTGNSLVFVAPTLDEGDATGITYSSSDETIATISPSGVVTITALSGNDVKEGSTTISAIFAGDVNYKAQTVSYTLTVADSRDAVSTPGFDTPSGEVAANTVVNFTCADGGVTYYYTVDGSTPTTASSTGSSVTIDAAKTVKVIATKTGYKPSSVADAAYTIAGVAANDGSLEHPYTVAEALAIIAGYSDKDKSATEVYVSGIIANVGAYNSTYHSVTYDISDDGQNANTLNIYSGKFVANTNFSSNDQISVNDQVIVYGYLYLYGSTKEMYQNNYIYSLNGKTKALTAGSLTATPNNANKQITVEWGAATGTESAISYVVNCGTQSYNANAAGSHTFTMADYGTYDITVTASASDAFSATVGTSTTLMAQGGNETITSGSFSGSNTSISMTTASGITISQLKDDGTNVNTTYNTVSTLRVYRANQMSFTGKAFTKIEMYYTGSYSGVDWTVSAGEGEVSIDTENKKVVWTNASGSSTVTLKNSTASGTNTQLRTTKFYFEYK